MKKSKILRNKHVEVACSEQEFKNIKALFSVSASTSFGDYVRNMLQAKPVRLKYGNASLDPLIEQLVAVRNCMEVTINHPALSDEDKVQIRSLQEETKSIINKIANACLPK